MTKAKKENAVILWNNFRKMNTFDKEKIVCSGCADTWTSWTHTQQSSLLRHSDKINNWVLWKKKSVKNRKKAIGTAKTASKVFAKKKYRNALGIALRAKKLYFTRVKNLLCTYLLSPCPSFALGRGDMFTFILRPKLSTTLMGAFWCVMFWIHRKPKGNAVLISANFVVLWYIGCPK